MNDCEYEDMYRRLYRMFDAVTPLKSDCGVLCGSACCHGDDHTGMLLFPHETTSLQVTASDGRRYAVCTGDCQRSLRPLSCRIFPFFPAIDDRGRVRAVIDERGRGLCPLIRQREHVVFRPAFLWCVKKAGRILAKDEACLAFLREVSQEIFETTMFAKRLENKN